MKHFSLKIIAFAMLFVPLAALNAQECHKSCAGHAGCPHHAAAQQGVKQKADEQQVSEVVAHLLSKRTDEERQTVARSFVRRLNMGTDQVVRFAKTFKSEGEALKFLRYASAYVIDPQNFHKASDTFTSEAYRNEFLSVFGKPGAEGK
ncbi:MAG: DUF4476 domain-containing protein [Bacteroidales bacterium]|nr:DUF4476 domain-containing protein [Bacteroidales bacterium]